MIQELVLGVLEGDLETLVSAAMSMGATGPKTDRNKLIEDVDEFLEKYGSTTSIADIDTTVIFEEFSDLAARNYNSRGDGARPPVLSLKLNNPSK